MNGMMFGGEGPVMQGTWYNPNTGDAFTVRDSFFEDNQYTVMTTDGRYLGFNQLQNYIQTDMKLEDLKKIKSEKQNTVKEELPAEVADLITENGGDPYAGIMTPEDMMIGNNKPNLGNLYRDDLPVQQTPVGNVYVDTSGSASMQNGIIEYAVNRIGSERILFGSDTYSAGAQRGRIDYAQISKTDKYNILRGNAERLFKLK
jgi:hypothetical protein